MYVSYCVFQVAATAAAEHRRVYETLFLGKERAQKLKYFFIFFAIPPFLHYRAIAALRVQL